MSDNSAEFLIKKLRIRKDRDDGSVVYDITSVINEVNIYEHIDKPYLTAQVLFADNDRIVERTEISGTEVVEIEITTDDGKLGYTIEKNFIITEIVRSVKTNDSQELVGISLIEDIGYYSRLIRLQKSYNGKPVDIIRDILIDNLNRELFNISGSQFKESSDMKVVIPNLNPLDAANWIKDRASSQNGMPFFLFSTICDDRIRFLDLEKILQLTPLNEGIYDYVYLQGSSGGFAAQDPRQNYIIRNFAYAGAEDQLMLARKGFINSTYNFIDTITNKSHTSRIDANEIFAGISFEPRQNIPVYDGNALINDRKMHDYNTSEISQIASSHTFEDGNYNYYQSDDTNSHMLKAKSKALRYFLHKTPIEISVPGHNFLHSDVNHSIGNLINVSFKANSTSYMEDDGSNNLDKRKSGSYMIYATRHIFQSDIYSAVVSCAKLAYKSQSGAI
jgi:hypothetical protein